MAHRRRRELQGEELHPLEQEQADQDNNEKLPQDVNDTWDWYYEGEEGQHEINYMEENWNDYDYDNSWDWNDNSYEDTANYIGGINESHLTTGHIRQAKSLLHKHKVKSLLGKKTAHTQHHGTTTARAFNNSPKRTQHNCASTWQQQHNSKETRRLRTPSHTTSCAPTSSHTITC